MFVNMVRMYICKQFSQVFSEFKVRFLDNIWKQYLKTNNYFYRPKPSKFIVIITYIS